MAKHSFLQDLEQKGWTVVPEVIPQSSCEAFREASLQWLEGFPHGFKRDDRSTWTNKHLPYSMKGGLYNRYSVNHEAFVWKIRTEPSLVKVFEQIWGTDDLIASFDGINVTLPVNEQHGRTDIEPTTPWPHMDQNPRRVDRLELYQGIANMSPNGPQDGGLVVLEGSHKLHDKHFASIGGWRPDKDAGPNENGYDFKDDADWYRQQGCKEVKVCANEGDLILWDSRTVHWNASPVGDKIRFISYVCYCPRSMMSQADLDKKLNVFKARKGTTHWPNMNVIPIESDTRDVTRPIRPDGSIDTADRNRPFVEPDETPAVLRLVGVRA